MKLLIAEKPSVGLAYKKLLEKTENEKFEKRDGFLQGKNWNISWCIGHLIELAPPKCYGWEEWKLEDLPMIPKKWIYKVKESTKKQFKILETLFQKAEIIVNGTDAGREGELIYRLVRNQFLLKNNVIEKRLWINSFTLKDMEKGWHNLKDSKEYNNLYESALVRSQSDWLIGMNFSRGYSLKTSIRGLSVGRVQTPTLQLIVKRDNEVENWKESYFHQLIITWGDLNFLLYYENTHSFKDSKFLEEVLKKCEGLQGKLSDIKETQYKALPPNLFDLANLQKEANKKLKFKAQQTLQLAQKLYEQKKITYPRTDSAHLPESMLNETWDRVYSFLSEEQKINIEKKHTKTKIFNDSKVTDHFAIIPTDETIEGSNLNNNELLLYNLIKEQFILAFGKPHIYKQIILKIECNNHTFQNKFIKILDNGFKKLIKQSDIKKDTEENAELTSPVSVGDIKDINDIKILKKKKTPVQYHSEASLISAMETAGKYIKDKALKEAMKKRGLGTPATKGEIIEVLKRREYIIEIKEKIKATIKGKELINIVNPKVKDATMTGEWEYKLGKIEKGEITSLEFLNEIQDYIKSLTKDFSKKVIMKVVEQTKENTCPKCKKLLKINDYGAFCENETCDFKIFIKIASKKISKGDLLKLIQGKKTPLIKGFTSQKGKKFNAKLSLIDFKVKFNF